MKRPESIEDVSRRCEECFTNFQKQIILHPVEKTPKGFDKYLTWANEDNTSHTLSKDFSFLHVWNKQEVEIGKQSGTAGLRAYRENIGGEKTQDLIKKDLLDEKPPLPSTSGTVSETIHPQPKELSAEDFALVKIRGEAKTNLILILALDQEIEAFWKRNNFPDNGQKKGLWLKELISMSKIL